MIDFRQNADAGAFVKKALKKFGLPTDLGAAIAALAFSIRDHRHLESILTGCDGEERQMLYDSIAPHLRFTPRPLDTYVASAGQRAEREQWPVLDEAGQLQPFKPAQDVATLEKNIEAELAKRWLKLVCYRCGARENFPQVGEETNVDVILKARASGWVYMPATEKESCPKCAKKLGLRLDA